MISWEEAVVEQCMACECAYVKDDPRQTLHNLINWHTELAKENMVSVWDVVNLRDKLNELISK
jgi:hypothetical protein